jgi:phenylacetate-CoA ligase
MSERELLEARQFRQFEETLRRVATNNRFYTSKYRGIELDSIRSLADLNRLPFTTKADLVADQERNPPYGTANSEPLSRYVRVHQTSGTTTGRPLRWLDTAESWSSLLDCWQTIFQIVELRREDRLFFPFSFGPFLGFWTAFESGLRAGHCCLAGGGMSSAARLRYLIDNSATVVFCTPTYALRLAEVAAETGIDLPDSPVRMLIVAGEPGGNIGPVRRKIEKAWGARVIDHWGMTEVGPAAVECFAQPGGLHLLEEFYLAEVIDLQTLNAVAEGQPGELVVTNLARHACPVIRYRTGDIVSIDKQSCRCGSRFVRFQGGVVGRADQMIQIRGNNVYPSALESIVRGFEEVDEFRIDVLRSATTPRVTVTIETRAAADAVLKDRVSAAIRDELQFRAEVTCVPPGTLPRFEMKSKRVFVDEPSARLT